MFVDVISGNGFRPREWHLNDINWTNFAMLDMIYFAKESTRAKTALKKHMIPQQSLPDKLRGSLKRKNERIAPNESYFELKKRIDSRNRFNELIDYIIEHYNQEQRLFMIKLVSENYFKLQKWLQRIV
jgi:hypothetical protein